MTQPATESRDPDRALALQASSFSESHAATEGAHPSTAIGFGLGRRGIGGRLGASREAGGQWRLHRSRRRPEYR